MGLFRRLGELGFDTQKAIVFGHALTAGRGAHFGIVGTDPDCIIGDKGIIGFSRTMSDDNFPTGGAALLDDGEAFGHGSNFIEFDDGSRAGLFVDGFLDPIFVGG